MHLVKLYRRKCQQRLVRNCSTLAGCSVRQHSRRRIQRWHRLLDRRDWKRVYEGLKASALETGRLPQWNGRSTGTNAQPGLRHQIAGASHKAHLLEPLATGKPSSNELTSVFLCIDHRLILSPGNLFTEDVEVHCLPPMGVKPVSLGFQRANTSNFAPDPNNQSTTVAAPQGRNPCL